MVSEGVFGDYLQQGPDLTLPWMSQGALLSEEDIQEARGKEKPSKGKKGKKSKKDFANAFDALGLEDDQGDSMANGEHHAAEVPSSNGLPAEEDEDGAPNLLPKQKKGKNKKGVDIDGAFAALAVEDGAEDGPANGRETEAAAAADDGEERGSDAQATTSQADAEADELLLGAKKDESFLLQQSNLYLRLKISYKLALIPKKTSTLSN